MPSDVICRRGEIGRELFLVSRGTLEVLSSDDSNVITLLKRGDVVGEMSLVLDDCHRTNTVRATTISELGVLTKADFVAMLNE